ncbi:hypothetical protein VE03_08899 [Pseudogymnoascus sp. 23342-1-I1]|nr:hypothetical protein VE03_08899 [Pseudogymnoascus sp. 23342-1-I1]
MKIFTLVLLALLALLLPLASACISNGDCTRGANGWVGYNCANEGDCESFKRARKNAGLLRQIVEVGIFVN